MLIGTTYKTHGEWEEFLEKIKPQFQSDQYDVFRHNCNDFTNECAKFLVGSEIPDYILNLPERVASTSRGKLVAFLYEKLRRKSEIKDPFFSTQGYQKMVFDEANACYSPKKDRELSLGENIVFRNKSKGLLPKPISNNGNNIKLHVLKDYKNRENRQTKLKLTRKKNTSLRSLHDHRNAYRRGIGLRNKASPRNRRDRYNQNPSVTLLPPSMNNPTKKLTLNRSRPMQPQTGFSNQNYQNFRNSTDFPRNRVVNILDSGMLKSGTNHMGIGFGQLNTGDEKRSDFKPGSVLDIIPVFKRK